MIGFLIKGLWRDRTRSLFPFLTVTAGVMITVFLQAYMSGVSANMSQSSASFSTGHLKVMSRAYAKEAGQAPNDLAYTGLNKLLGELRRDAPGVIWTPRIRFAGLLDIPDQRGETRAQAPVMGLGIDLLSGVSQERKILNLERSLVRGRMPAGRGEMLVSDDLAGRLGVGPGDTATLITATMYGAMAAANFTIAGTVRLGVRAMDRGTMFADIRDVQQALDMEDSAGEILGLFPDFLYRAEAARSIADRLNVRWRTSADEFAPTALTMRDQPGFAEIMDYSNSMARLAVLIFTLVMSVVLWNAGLIASLRRYGEIGLRLAFGEDKGRLYRAMVVESLFIGLAGSAAGTLLGLVPSYWLQAKGYDVGSLMRDSSLMMDTVIRARITAVSFFIGFIPGLLATSIGTAISGIGVYRRQTATLIKELEA